MGAGVDSMLAGEIIALSSWKFYLQNLLSFMPCVLRIASHVPHM